MSETSLKHAVYNPIVSIVTPVYNQEDTIVETIESVLNQSYQNIEYIVVNDGSNDGTASKLAQFESLVTVVYQEHRGQAAAINNGWLRAKGDYLSYVSGDDVLYKDCIKNLINAVDDKAVLYYGDYDLINEKSRKIKTVFTKEYSKNGLVSDLICYPGLAPLFRKEYFTCLGGWNTAYKFIPDFEFWIRMSDIGYFSRVPNVGGGVRVHVGSGSIKSITAALADEIINLSAKNALSLRSDLAKNALLNGKLISARLHLQSNRHLVAFNHFFGVFCGNPIFAIKPLTIKFFIGGFLKRHYYEFKRLLLGSMDSSK